MWIALRFTLLLLAALFLFTQWLRRASMFYPERYPSGDWSLPVAHRDVDFRTRDGVKLHGWLIAAADPHAPLLIWCHGNGGNITERAPIAAELARRGASVLLFDWRGYGKSEGTPSEGKLYDDALAAYDFAASMKQPIAMYGESLGGPYAAYVASKRTVSCVVIENSFPSLRQLGNALYRPFPLGWFAPFAMTTTRWLNAAKVPVLVMHGRRDGVIPFALGQQLYDDLATPRKELFISNEAGHSMIPSVEGERYYAAVVRFVRAASAES